MDHGNILFRTKLNIPFGLKSAVLRPRIMEELDKALEVKLTLITAPAGFGKTTAAANWVRQCGIPAVWISIDSFDNNIRKFWSYVIAALETVIPGTAEMFSRYLYNASEFNAEGLVAVLVDEISKSGADFILVLDDYHLIQDAAIHESLGLFIKYMPSNGHVIISGRSRPPFITARFEISGEIMNMGINELRFESSEIEDLSRSYDITLTKNELKLLEELLEGWAVGLRLLFDSMCKDKTFDISKLVSGSGWDSNKIAAYLMEEVMDNFSEEDNSFMVKTSILSQINGSLCDELTGRSDGYATLERLSMRNAFIVPVDSEGKWYRYHHLFSEFLQNMLAGSDQFSLGELQEKAGNWYEKNGYIEEAVSYYMQCGNIEKVMAVIEANSRQLLKTGDFSVLKQWLAWLPATSTRSNDRLCLTYAWALMLSGSVNEAEIWMNVLEERFLIQYELSPDDSERRQIRFEILYFKTLAGIWTDDRQGILLMLKKMKELTNESFSFDYGLNVNSGEACLIAGMLGLKGKLSLLEEYAAIYETAREDVIKQNIGYIPGVIGEMYFERNNVDNAVPFLSKALEEAEEGQTAGSFIPAEITMARILKAKGDIMGAYGIISDAEMKLAQMGGLNFQPILSAFRARIGIECEDRETVEKWLRVNCIDVHDAPSLHRIYEHITLARSLISRKDYDGAILLLNKLLIFARKNGNIFYTIEILNLLAIACHAAGQTHHAMTALRESLLLGEKEGYERHFIEEGMAMAALLGRFLRQNDPAARNGEFPSVSPIYIRKLLADTKEYCITIKTYINKKGSGREKPNDYIKPLTKRENEILRFLSAELTNAEIARTLDISLNTVKVNCTNIYRKLDVKRREQAVSRARELNILK